MSTGEEGRVLVGPAGWSYEDWKGIVYPPGGLKGRHALEFLCECFDMVEVNSTFYRLPVARHCASWLTKVEANPRFKFTLKLWEGFTHTRDRRPSEEEIAQVFEGLRPLEEAGRLGAVLVQFPWSFKRNDENRLHLGRIVDTFASLPLALEIRHRSWETPAFFDGLTARKIAFCNVDQPIFDDSLEATEHVTAPIGYVRLHGRNRADWFREDAGRDDRYNYLYDEEELEPWLRRIESIKKRTSEIYVVTNNHYRGQAVVNALEIQFGLGRRDFELPQSLIDAYPRLRKLIVRKGLS